MGQLLPHSQAVKVEEKPPAWHHCFRVGPGAPLYSQALPTCSWRPPLQPSSSTLLLVALSPSQLLLPPTVPLKPDLFLRWSGPLTLLTLS